MGTRLPWAVRNHLDSVSWGTPTSGARAVAVLARGPLMRCTILDLKGSVYSVIVQLLSASCYATPDIAQKSGSSGVTTILTQGGTEGGVALAFVEAGIPREHIVLAFHHPSRRPLTDFATG